MAKRQTTRAVRRSVKAAKIAAGKRKGPTISALAKQIDRIDAAMQALATARDKLRYEIGDIEEILFAADDAVRDNEDDLATLKRTLRSLQDSVESVSAHI